METVFYRDNIKHYLKFIIIAQPRVYNNQWDTDADVTMGLFNLNPPPPFMLEND